MPVPVPIMHLFGGLTPAPDTGGHKQANQANQASQASQENQQSQVEIASRANQASQVAEEINGIVYKTKHNVFAVEKSL